MKDPLAPENTYDRLHLSMNSTPSEIEEAVYCFIENNPGQERVAIQMEDELVSPETRLMLDIFQYQECTEIMSSDDFAFELPLIEPEDITRIEQHLMDALNERVRKINFETKVILDLDLEQ